MARKKNRDVAPKEVAERAYALWESRGCPQGDGRGDWLAAEQELRKPEPTRASRRIIPRTLSRLRLFRRAA